MSPHHTQIQWSSRDQIVHIIGSADEKLYYNIACILIAFVLPSHMIMYVYQNLTFLL